MKFHNPGVVPFLLAVALLGGLPLGPHTTGDDLGDAAHAEANGDAGDTQDTATALPSTGTYEATFAGAEDTDWFRLDVSSEEAVCIESLVQGDDDVAGEALLVASADRALRAHDGFSDKTVTGVSFLLPKSATVFLRLAPTDGTTTGEYKFNLQTYTRDELDGEGALGTDAGNTQATATYLPKGCLHGSLQASTGDEVDWFQFRADEGDVLVLAIRASESYVPLTLLDPDGNEVVTVSGTDVAKVELTTSGHWYLRVGQSSDASTTATSSDSDYEISTTDDSPCRPNCELT